MYLFLIDSFHQNTCSPYIYIFLDASCNGGNMILDHYAHHAGPTEFIMIKSVPTFSDSHEEARTNILNFARLSSTHKHIKFCSFKHYSVDLFTEPLTSLNFPNYPKFNDASNAYDEFIQKIMIAIDKVAPTKERRLKHNSQEWSDGEISEAIRNREKLLKKFKRSRLHIDKELYNAAQYKVPKMIFNKKNDYSQNKLNEFIGKPKELWKVLNSLGLPKKIFMLSTN